MAKPKIAIIMGSSSDMKIMEKAGSVLKEFNVPYDIKILSAHRTPADTIKYAKEAKRKGIEVIIAGAGGAAHLAGVIAAHTILPVLGVPMETQYLKGIDSLFSTVQMPSGIPVGCMSIGEPGAKNAALLALEILAISDKVLLKKLERHRKKLASAVKGKR